jgi:hypothetical protein
MGLPWIKVWVEILDDVKVNRLTEVQHWRFVQLILLAAECDAAGALVTGDLPMTHRDVSFRLRCDENGLSQDIKDMVKVGLLHIENGVIVVSKFSERQGPTQAEKRKAWRERQEARRERVKLENVTQESPVTHANVTHIEEERDLKREEAEEDLKGAAAPSALITDRDAERMFCEVTNFVSIPPGELKRLDQIIGFIRAYGWETTKKVMITVFQGWVKTPRKNGTGNYSALNLIWVDKVQEVLAGYGSGEKDPSAMTDKEWMEYIRQLAKETT